MFPRIDSPCPLRAFPLPNSGNFNCSVCRREVHDLSDMSVEQINVLINQCSGEVCVYYKVKATVSTVLKSAAAGVFVVSTTGLALPVVAADFEENEEELKIMVTGGGVKLSSRLSLHMGAQPPVNKDTDLEVPRLKDSDVEQEPQTIPIIEI